MALWRRQAFRTWLLVSCSSTHSVRTACGSRIAVVVTRPRSPILMRAAPSSAFFFATESRTRTPPKKWTTRRARGAARGRASCRRRSATAPRTVVEQRWRSITTVDIETVAARLAKPPPSRRAFLGFLAAAAVAERGDACDRELVAMDAIRDARKRRFQCASNGGARRPARSASRRMRRALQPRDRSDFGCACPERGSAMAEMAAMGEEAEGRRAEGGCEGWKGGADILLQHGRVQPDIQGRAHHEHAEPPTGGLPDRAADDCLVRRVADSQRAEKMMLRLMRQCASVEPSETLGPEWFKANEAYDFSRDTRTRVASGQARDRTARAGVAPGVAACAACLGGPRGGHAARYGALLCAVRSVRRNGGRRVLPEPWMRSSRRTRDRRRAR